MRKLQQDLQQQQAMGEREYYVLQGYLVKVVVELMDCGLHEISGHSAEVVQEWRTQHADYDRARTLQS